MSSGRDGETQDLAFERLLLESAHDDGPSPGSADRAWREFGTRVAATAIVSGAVADPTALARAARRAMLKWLGIGVAGGSAFTALWMHSGETWRSSPPGVVQPPAIVSPRTEPRVVQPLSQAPVGSPSASTDSRVGHLAPAPSPAPLARKAPQRAKSAAVRETSLLAKEIASLDAARTAIAASDASGALRVVEEYRREFPTGQLMADAHALEIEALLAQGDRPGAQRRFERFRARFPNDPHAARLEQLVGQ